MGSVAFKTNAKLVSDGLGSGNGKKATDTSTVPVPPFAATDVFPPRMFQLPGGVVVESTE